MISRTVVAAISLLFFAAQFWGEVVVPRPSEIVVCVMVGLVIAGVSFWNLVQDSSGFQKQLYKHAAIVGAVALVALAAVHVVLREFFPVRDVVPEVVSGRMDVDIYLVGMVASGALAMLTLFASRRASLVHARTESAKS